MQNPELIKYSTTLTANTEYTVVLEVNLDKLPMLRVPIAKSLLKLKEIKEEIINKIVKEKQTRSQTMEITYHHESIGNRISLNLEEMQVNIEKEYLKTKKHSVIPSNNYKTKSVVTNFNQVSVKRKETNSNVDKIKSLFFKPFLTMLDITMNNFGSKGSGIIKNFEFNNSGSTKNKLSSLKNLGSLNNINGMGNTNAGACTIREASEVTETTSRREIERDSRDKDRDRENNIEDIIEIKENSNENMFSKMQSKNISKNNSFLEIKPSNLVKGCRKKLLEAERRSIKISLNSNDMPNPYSSIKYLDSYVNTENTNNNIITTEADNVLSTRATRSNTFNINNGKNHRDNDISPTIKRTIKLFDMKSQSIHSYRSGRFDLPLITSIDMNTNKK